MIEIEKNQKFIFIRSERERILTDLDVKIQDFETFYNEKFFKLFLLNIREVNKLKNSNINFVNYDKFFYDIEKLEKLGNYSGDDKYEITNILEDFYYVVVLVNTIKHVDNNKSLLSKKFRIQIYEFQEQEKIQKQKIKEEEEEKKKDSKTKQIKTKEKDDIIPIQSYSNKSQYNYLKPKENGSNVFILPRNNTTNLEVFKNCVDLDKSKKLKMNMKYFRVLQHLFEEKKDLFKENSNIKRFFELILHEKIHINKFFISGENSEDETLFLDLIYFFTNLQTNSNEIDLKFSNIKLNNDIIVEINKMLTEKLNAKKIDDNVISWDKITDMDGNQIYITDEYGNKINISFGPKIMKLRFRNMIKSININEGKVLLNISERFYPSNASKLKKVFNNILKLKLIS